MRYLFDCGENIWDGCTLVPKDFKMSFMSVSFILLPYWNVHNGYKYSELFVNWFGHILSCVLLK